jgi:hypothetical protein
MEEAKIIKQNDMNYEDLFNDFHALCFLMKERVADCIKNIIRLNLLMSTKYT